MSRGPGVALIAVVLTLAAAATLVLGTASLVRFDMLLTANRQSLAQSRAESRSRLTLALLELEQAARSGQLPESPPATPGLVAYQRTSPTTARLAVVGEAGGGSYLSEAAVEVRTGDHGWELHVTGSR